jgi:2-iminobutanoate/2-iminopropanoate deaminase
MIMRLPAHYGDETCSSCVIAGDLLFCAHHAGGFESNDVAHQLEEAFNSLGETLAKAGADFDDIVQINLYLKRIEDFNAAKDVFYRYFKEGYPARMTSTSEFVSKDCLCMLDAVAYKKQ